MYYSEINRHIINKKYFWNYSISIVTSLVLGYLYFDSINISVAFFRNMLFLVSIFWLLTVPIGCILTNIYRCQTFLKFYNNFLRGYDVQFFKIAIEKEDYKMQVFYTSHNATIRPFPKSTNAICIETDDFLLLFLSIKYSGIFQLVLKPFIFVKTNKEFHLKDKNANIIQDFKMTEIKQNRIIIFPNKDGIKRLMIPAGVFQNLTN